MHALSLRASKATRFRALRCAVLPWRPGARAHVKQIPAIDESASSSSAQMPINTADMMIFSGADLKSRWYHDSKRAR